jgi:hypothetical protein
VLLDREELKERLAALREEHRVLDEAIENLTNSQGFDMLKLQRLKKRKLSLKDIIAKIESMLLDDIVA